MLHPKTKYSISAIWWFYLPLALFFGIMISHLANPAFHKQYIEGELGFLENFHTLIIGAAFFVAAFLLKPIFSTGNKWLTAWVGIACLACLYIFLEEISYGQHFMQWEASEYWQNINDQNETNLHNTSSWLDQKPRLILEIGVIIGGIIMPLLARFKPSALPEKFNIIYPSSALFIISILAELVHMSDALYDVTKVTLFGRSSELQETFYFYFMLIYLVMLRRKIKLG